MPKVIIHRVLHSPFGLQLGALGLLMFFVTGFRPPYFLGGEVFEFSMHNREDNIFVVGTPGFLKNTVGVQTAGFQEIITTDEAGNEIKKLVKKKRDKVLNYTVKSGDNISSIAHKFGIKVSTILWANNLNVKQTIQPGQRLDIPPTDGVFYTVKKGETLVEIADLHDIEVGKIRAYNPIKNNLIQPGQKLFLPEAKRIYIAAKPANKTPSTKPNKVNVGKSAYPNNTTTNTSAPSSIGITFRRPTQGILTQGFHRGHYGIDIASKMNTPIYASASGKVVKSATGWNWGYGNYIVVDHGNGIETLYAHNNVLKVSAGDTVKKGQLLALMGNTGNVRGRTGIHLHFELRINGRKVNPFNYF